MKIQILGRWNTVVKFEFELTTEQEALSVRDQRGLAIKAALAADSNLSDSNLSDSNLSGSNLSGSNLSGSNLSGSNLSDSDLRGSDLSGSNLRGSNLSGSNLSDSNLSGSNLSDSNLRGSNLSGSNLSDSNLRGSDLSGSDLSGSDLSGSDLSGSNLSGSNLSGSDLRGSDLTPIRDDLWAVLSSAPMDVSGLLAALKAGRVDGSTYEGECACLVGTIAHVNGAKYDRLAILKPNSRRPAEMFFLGISKGDTPDNSQFSALAVEWIEDWRTRMVMAFGSKVE